MTGGKSGASRRETTIDGPAKRSREDRLFNALTRNNASVLDPLILLYLSSLGLSLVPSFSLSSSPFLSRSRSKHSLQLGLIKNRGRERESAPMTGHVFFSDISTGIRRLDVHVHRVRACLRTCVCVYVCVRDEVDDYRKLWQWLTVTRWFDRKKVRRELLAAGRQCYFRDVFSINTSSYPPPVPSTIHRRCSRGYTGRRSPPEATPRNESEESP